MTSKRSGAADSGSPTLRQRTLETRTLAAVLDLRDRDRRSRVRYPHSPRRRLTAANRLDSNTFRLTAGETAARRAAVPGWRSAHVWSAEYNSMTRLSEEDQYALPPIIGVDSGSDTVTCASSIAGASFPPAVAASHVHVMWAPWWPASRVVAPSIAGLRPRRQRVLRSRRAWRPARPAWCSRAPTRWTASSKSASAPNLWGPTPGRSVRMAGVEQNTWPGTPRGRGRARVLER